MVWVYLVSSRLPSSPVDISLFFSLSILLFHLEPEAMDSHSITGLGLCYIEQRNLRGIRVCRSITGTRPKKHSVNLGNVTPRL